MQHENKYKRFKQNMATFVKSKKFVWLVVAIFVVQASFFVLAIKTANLTDSWKIEDTVSGVAPDEHRHYSNIKFYAERDILAGPVIKQSEMKNPKFYHLGEATRFPSYFYYYVLSFPAKILMKLGASDLFIYMSLRLFSILFGVLTLFVIRKIFTEIKAPALAANLSLLAIAVTQAFVQIGSVINYDMPSLLLFCLVILFCARSIRHRQLTPLLLTIPLTLFVAITKYTYLPFAGLAVIAAAVVVFTNNNQSVRDLVPLAKKYILSQRVIGGFTITLTLLGGVLFSERIIQNVVSYHSVNPSCNKLASQRDCLRFSIYSRNYELKNAQSKAIKNGDFNYTYENFSSIGRWITTYAKSTYVYTGHVVSSVTSAMSILFVLIILFLLVSLGINRTKVLENTSQKFVVYGAMIYCVSVYIFNERSYYILGEHKANQGRYILFSLIFFYFWFAMLSRAAIRTQNKKRASILKSSLVTLALVCLIVMNSLSSFFVTINLDPNTAHKWLREPYAHLLEINKG